MIDIDKIVKRVSNKEFPDIPKEHFENFARRLIESMGDLSQEANEDKILQNVRDNLRKIDYFMFDEANNYPLDPEERPGKRFKDVIDGTEDIRALTLEVPDFERLCKSRFKFSECFAIAERIKQYDIPEDKAIDLACLSKKLREQIINNLDEDVFQKIVKNGYCKLYDDVEKKGLTSKKDKAEFLNIINIPNSILPPGKNEKLWMVDNWAVNTVEDIHNIDNIRDNKIGQIMANDHSETYTVYEMKTEFCRRFLNIDPMALETMFYIPENQEILSKLDAYGDLIDMIQAGETERDRMTVGKLYAKYLYSNETIDLPGNLKMKAYMYVDDEQIDKFNNKEVDYTSTRGDYAVYFNRFSLAQNATYKKTRKECELELPYEMIKKGNPIQYEYTAIPKLVFPKEELDFDAIKKTYISLEAIECDMSLMYPKYYGKEIPKSYTAFQFQEQEKERARVRELSKAELFRKMARTFGSAGVDIRDVEKKFGGSQTEKYMSAEEIEGCIDKSKATYIDEDGNAYQGGKKVGKVVESEDDPGLY